VSPFLSSGRTPVALPSSGPPVFPLLQDPLLSLVFKKQCSPPFPPSDPFCADANFNIFLPSCGAPFFSPLPPSPRSSLPFFFVSGTHFFQIVSPVFYPHWRELFQIGHGSSLMGLKNLMCHDGLPGFSWFEVPQVHVCQLLKSPTTTGSLLFLPQLILFGARTMLVRGLNALPLCRSCSLFTSPLLCAPPFAKSAHPPPFLTDGPMMRLLPLPAL